MEHEPAHHDESPKESRGWRVLAGIAIAVGVYALLGQSGLSEGGRLTAAVGALMAAWWVSEAAPLEVTGLVPLALFPVLGIATIKETATPYAQDIIFLFLGGMLLGQAMERWGLHQRFASAAITAVGAGPARLVGAFLLSTAFISMWVSNTAATVMMMPIALSVGRLVSAADREGKTKDLCTALLLAVAFGATIGGVGTVIGTPPIAQYAGYMRATFNHPVTFAAWLAVGLPVLALVLPATWLVLTRVAFRLPWRSSAAATGMVAPQVPWTGGERRTLVIFAGAAVLWVATPLLATAPMFQGTATGAALARLGDASIAIGAAVLLFLVPAAGLRGRPLLTWREGERVPWGILLLFGGGLSLAEALKSHKVDVYLASMAGPLAGWPVLGVMVLMSVVAIVLTEFASNTALVAAALPVAAPIAEKLGIPPAVLLTTVTLSASLGFMMPGGTAPNALVFASGEVTMRKMMKAGVWLDVACGLGVPVLVYAIWQVGWLPGV